MRLFLALLFAVVALALKSELDIDNDSRTAFHISSFGFEEGGVLSFELKDFTLMVPAHNYDAPADDKFNIAFVLQRSVSDTSVRLEDSSKVCFHQKRINAIDDDVIKLNDRSKWEMTKFQKTITKPGYYHLYFSNCEPKVHTSFKLSTEEYNVDNGERVYLSTGLSGLPTMIGFAAVLFCGMFVAWSIVLKRSYANVRSIHWLMLVVVAFKIFTLIFETAKLHALKTTGENNGWAYLFYFFSFLKGMLLFAVIVLIGTGWSYLKPFLTERDKLLMQAVLVIQAMVNVAMAVVDEMAPGAAGGVTWTDILHLLDMICCCVILFPIIWSIRHLRNAGAGGDGKAQRNMARLKKFRTFYLLAVSYIYFTRIILYLLEATLPFKLSWMGPVFGEVAALLFYGTTGYLFRPQESSPYLALSKDDDDVRMAPEDIEL